MIAPTLLVTIYMTWQQRKYWPDLIHNIAVCLWICANIVWMCGEFFLQDSTRPYARIFFIMGLATLAGYYSYAFIQHLRGKEVQ